MWNASTRPYEGRIDEIAYRPREIARDRVRSCEIVWYVFDNDK